MAIGYLDVFCGISGDMFLGALVDAGVDPDELRAHLQRLPVAGWELAVTEARKMGLRGTQVRVLAEAASASQAARAPVHHAPKPDHRHEPGPESEHDHGHRQHGAEGAARFAGHGRSAEEIIGLIQQADLSAAVIGKSVAVVERIAQAEAACHGVPRAQVHFHELGGLDTIIDVVGTVVGLELLALDRLFCSPLPVSHGFVDTAHGRLPVPAPAVAKLLEGVATVGLDVSGETVTPTGAALAVCLAEIGPFPAMKVRRVGLGAGVKDFPVPNLLRLMVGEPLGSDTSLPSDTVVLLEANLDDMSPELYARAMDQAFAAGALDVWATPIQMKKNRPAMMISVLAPPAAADAVTFSLLRETTSFGVRRQYLQRQCLEREHTTVETPFGPIRLKVGRLHGESLTVAPEYEDCRAAAEAHDVPLKLVYAAAVAAGLGL